MLDEPLAEVQLISFSSFFSPLRSPPYASYAQSARGHGGTSPLRWLLAERWGHRPPQSSHRLRSRRHPICSPCIRAFGPLSSLSRLVLARRIRGGIQEGLPWARFPEDSTVDFEKIMRRTDASLLLAHACFG